MKITFKTERDLHEWLTRNDPFVATAGRLSPPCYTVVWKRFVYPFLQREAA